MSRLDRDERTADTGKASLVMRRYRMIGLALLVGVPVCLLVRLLELPLPTLAELEVQTPSLLMIWILLLGYVLLLAIPFVPSAEIGLAVLLVLGSSMALPVYAATILGLTIAFGAGRHAHLFRHSTRRSDAQQSSDAIAALHERLRDRPILRRILRFRGLAFIAMINMPGNTVVGGGGGIAMAVGYSRALTFKEFLICAAVAVAPVPVLFLVAHQIGLEIWVHAWLDRILATPL